MVARDIDVLVDLKRTAQASVLLSIPFIDSDLCRLIEPGAPTPERRFAAMQKLAEAGIAVGIMTAPIIPGLNDRDLPALLSRAADCGATNAAYVALRLPGSVQSVFLSRLQRLLPLRYGHVVARIREVRGNRLNDARFGHRMRGQGNYWESVRDLFQIAAARNGLSQHCVHSANPDHLPRSDKNQYLLPFTD